MVSLRGVELERFASWSGDQLVTPGPNGGRLLEMDVDESTFEEFLQATGLRRAVEPKPAPPPAVPVAPKPDAAQLAAEQRATAEAFERHWNSPEQREKRQRELIADYCGVHEISGLAKAIRVSGGPTLLQRAEAWAAAGRPGAESEQPKTKGGGLASAIRFSSN